MASSAPTSPLRQLFENRLSQLSTEVEADFAETRNRIEADFAETRNRVEAAFADTRDRVEALFAETRDRARLDFAEQLNQAVRRMRQVSDAEELAGTLVDAAGLFATALAFLRIDERVARGERIRGVSPETAEKFPGLPIPLATAPALAGAVESCDQVTAVPTAAEVSAELAGVFGHSGEGRVTIFPIEVRDTVRALVYTSGSVQTPAVEMLCQVAAAVWSSMEPVVVNVPAPAPELVQIAAPAASKRDRPTWESLPVEEQKVHLRAQRFARVQVADMRLHDAAAVQSGRKKRDLYGALRQRVDDARTVFRERFFAACPSMVDYLHVELVKTLAQEDAELLGKDYPGPLV
jgi:hypothetical protein